MRFFGVLTSFLSICLLTAAGCNQSAESNPVGTAKQENVSDNGLSVNGLSVNGLSVNGLRIGSSGGNGLGSNGLTATTGLATTDFANWFSNNSEADVLMTYIVKCALPSGQTLSYTPTGTSTTYTWDGELGLASNWTSGKAPTVAEKQVVSACLAAHVNKFGVSVPISILGLDGNGSAIPYTSQELTDYPVTEGCFFGNLFDTIAPVKVGNDGLSYASSESGRRMCAASGSDALGCGLAWVGSCSTYCTKDSTNTYYVSCTYSGVTYKPITTRIVSEVYTCGDDQCQVSEKCGTGSTPDNCGFDCGACP